MSDLVKSFNVFDIFTNLVPGMMCLTLFAILLPVDVLNKWNELPNEKYTVFIIMCYSYGWLLNGLYNCLKRIIRYFYDCNKKYYKDKWILTDEETRETAKRLIKEINNSDSVDKDKASYAIKYMLIALNTSGKNDRKDKLSALSDMNGVIGVGFLLIIISQLCFWRRGFTPELLGYRLRIGILFLVMVIAGCRCCEFQHHKYVQTIISYEYLQKEKAEKSKRKKSEPQEDTDQKADEDKAQGDV